MSQKSRLVHIVDDVPELDAREPGEPLTLVLVLDGFLDAGNAAGRAAQHLADLSDGPIVATFDVDELHDYRARRPAMSFVRDHYDGYDAPRLVTRLLRDAGDTPYLLLHGPEPDTKWEGFARAVRKVVERFGVTRVVSMGSVPMAVPHTRPIAITHHANDTALLSGTVRGAASCGSRRAPRHCSRSGWGSGATTRWASSRTSRTTSRSWTTRWPRRSSLEHVERAGRLTIDISGLRAEAEDREAEIARYLASNEEVGEVVAALEQQYDSFERSEQSGDNLLASDEPLPTGEEIGRQVEQFLAGLDGPDAEHDQT